MSFVLKLIGFHDTRRGFWPYREIDIYVDVCTYKKRVICISITLISLTSHRNWRLRVHEMDHAAYDEVKGS